MFRLFKAAARSLRNIKTTVTGLTILIFLTSAIFTLLSDVRSAYNQKFEEYEQISRLHDVTLDLDVNNEGTLPNGAYTQGTDSMYNTGDGKETYMELGTEGFQTTILSQGYQSIDSFTTPIYAGDGELIQSETTGDTTTNVFDTARLVEDYQLWKATVAMNDDGSISDPFDADSLYAWDMDTKTFTPRETDQYIDRYELVDGAQELMYDAEEVSVGDTITVTDSMDSFADYFKINWWHFHLGWWNYKHVQMWMPQQDIYLNMKTKEVAMNNSVGAPTIQNWLSDGVAFKLPSDVRDPNSWVTHLFGFASIPFYNEYSSYFSSSMGINMEAAGTKIWQSGHRDGIYGNEASLSPTYNDSSLLLSANSNRTSWWWNNWGGDENSYGFLPNASFQPHNWNETWDHGILINDTFKWPSSLGGVSYSHQEAKAVLEYGTSYHIPDNWTGDIKSEVIYTKNTFSITDTNMWTGSYLDWWNSLEDEVKSELSTFSYWTKSVIKEGYPVDPSIADPNGEFFGVVLTTDVEKRIYEFDYDDDGNILPEGGIARNTSLLNLESLADPETNRQEFITQFNDITNSDKESELLSIISEGARTITRLNLESSAAELVGEDNIGRRTTMTISSFDTTANKTQVFHFVNASANSEWNDELGAYESNVGRMYYEELDPTALLYMDSNKPYASIDPDHEFKFDNPPPTYSTSMIASIFRGYHVSDEYFSVDVDYMEYLGEGNQQFVKLEPTDQAYGINYVTKVGEEYHILDSTLEPVFTDSKGNIVGKTYSELHAYMILGDERLNVNNSSGLSYAYDLAGEINQNNGWYTISSANKNLIVPVEYRNLPTTAIERAIQDDEYDVFVSAIRQTLEGILSVGSNPWVSNDVLTYLTYGVEEAMEENYFYTVMESGYIDQSHIGKIAFDALYYADQRNRNQPIINRLFTGFIDHINIELNKVEGTGQDKIDAQKIYLKNELVKMQSLFENTFHLILPFDITELVDYSLDPVETLNGFGDVLKSVNTDEWLDGIKIWYDNNYDGINPIQIGEHNGNPLFNYFGTQELLTPLFSSADGGQGAINNVALTTGINRVVESLDFNKVMDKIMDTVTAHINNPTQAAAIKNVFEQMGIDSSYSNVKQGLQDIISKLDASQMMSNISASFNKREHIMEKEVDGEIWAFKTSYVTQLEMVSSILGGIFANRGDHVDIVAIVVDMFNLSGKVDDVSLPSLPVIGPPNTNLVKPGEDESALDLYDLQTLETLSYTNLENERDVIYAYNSNNNNDDFAQDAADVLSNRYGVNINWEDTHTLNYYADLYMSIINTGYTFNEYNEAANLADSVSQFNGNSLNFSMADIALWTLKDTWTQVGSTGYYTDGSGKQAYDAVKETVTSDVLSAGANSLVMWNNYIGWLEMIIHDLMEDGYSYNNAMQTAFNELWKVIDLGSKDATAQQGQAVDNGYTSIPIIGIEVSGATYGSALAIDPESHRFGLLGDPTSEVEQTPTAFQTGYQRLRDISPTFAASVDNDPDTFVREMGLVGWSVAQSNNTGTEPGRETGRWYSSLYHLFGWNTVGGRAETSIYKILKGGEEQLEALVSLSNETSTQSQIFDMLGLNPVVSSTYMGVIFPGVAKDSTIAFDQSIKEGNIKYVVERELANLADKGLDGWMEGLEGIVSDDILPHEVENHGTVGLKIDMYYIQHLIDEMRESGDDTFFDLNVTDLFESVINSATEVHTEENQIRFMNIGSYVAKVSESYMLANGKKAYGDDPSHLPLMYDENNPNQKYIDNIDDMVALVETIDPAYTINVNNQKFLILGRETTVDYMYPVLDEANINVDTANQAVVFVNDFGFQRVMQANQATAVKDYLILSSDDFEGVIINPETGDIVPRAEAIVLPLPYENRDDVLDGPIDDPAYEEHDDFHPASAVGLKEALNEVVRIRIDGNVLQKAYLSTESDPINPERAMRITTVQGVIDSVSQLQFYGVLILMTLVGLVTIFIAGRYVETRRVVIGILRAQGYSKHRIALSFIVFGVVTATVGGVAGYLTGHFLQIPLMEAFTTFWTVPTEPYTFSYISLVTSVVAPIVGLSVLIIAASLFILRSKPTELMSGAAEASTGALQRFMIKPFKKFSIVTRFRTTLALGSFFKMMALAMTFALTATVALFTLGSVGVFDRALAGTYDQRDYEYATDLFTPTLEGGGYDQVDKNALEDLEQLYIPMGMNQESATHYWDYFKPGHSRIMDLKYYEDVPGGDSGYTDMTDAGKAHILTKSSLDINIDSAIAANPWELAKNSMPDSQYVSALNITAAAAAQMMFNQFSESWTVNVDGYEVNAKSYYQDLYNQFVESPETDSNGYMIDPFVSSGADRYMEMMFTPDNHNDSSHYYHYKPITANDGSFLEYVWNQATTRFDARPISSTEESREMYREFLIDAYQQEDIQDYTMIYGGVNLDENFDETYSWAEVSIDGNTFAVSTEKVKMTGIEINFVTNDNGQEVYAPSPSSQIQPVTDKDEDIREIIFNATQQMESNFELWGDTQQPGSKNNPYPIAPNEVVLRRWGLSIGDVVASDVYNKTDRYLDNKILPIGELDDKGNVIANQNDEVYFEVVEVNSTYINTEIIADQDVVNAITGMELATWRDGVVPFNGVMSDNEVPQQAVESLLLYSQSGYWGAMDTFTFPMAKTDVINSVNQLFGDVIDNSSGLKGALQSSMYTDAEGNEQNVYSLEDLEQWVQSVSPDSTYQDLLDNVEMGLTDPDNPTLDLALLESMLRSYTGKYGNTIYSSSIHALNAQNIEAGFVTNITHTVSTLVNASVVVTLVVSIIILIIISTMIVNENKKKIATFAVMGYSEWEKIRMFLFVYTPFILLGIGAAIPVAYGMVAVFNAVVLTTSNMALPLALTWWHILIATIITTVIISGTVSVAYRAIRNIKPIYILQGDD